MKLMKSVRVKCLCCWLVCVAGAIGEDVPASSPVTANPPPQPAASAAGGSSGETGAVPPPEQRRTVELYGMKYVLMGSSRNDSVETEEYVLENESASNWTQLLTYQRITLPEPTAADKYVMQLKRHMEQTAHAPRFKPVQQGREAALFGVHYPPTDTQPEQFGLALVTVPDSRRPNELHLIQYSAKPEKLNPAELDLQVRRWQARFQSQASSVAR